MAILHGALLTILNGQLAIRELLKIETGSTFSNISHFIHSQKFGIYSVDFNDPSRPRAQKLSGKTYAQIVADNGFPAPAKK
jgi:hypothetical protein